MTHPSSACVEASAIYAVTIARAIREGGSGSDLYEWALNWASINCRDASIWQALDAAQTGAPQDYMHDQGWVLIALQNAYYQLVHAPTLEQGVIATVRAGGDTDTNAAICGALLGSVYGRDAIPDQWQRMVQSCRPLSGQVGVHRPRPAVVWPSDVLVLAEQLAGAANMQDVNHVASFA